MIAQFGIFSIAMFVKLTFQAGRRHGEAAAGIIAASRGVNMAWYKMVSEWFTALMGLIVIY